MCGIFGVHGHSDAVHLAQLGLYSLQHRGQESVGVAVFEEDGAARVVRSMGTMSSDMAADLDRLQGRMAVGHTRYSTAGSSTIDNAQPVFVRSRGGYIALAHNGNLINAGEMRQDLESTGSIFSSTMDSEVLVHRLAKSNAPTRWPPTLEPRKLRITLIFQARDNEENRRYRVRLQEQFS